VTPSTGVLRSVSFGCGVQSVALLALAAQRRIDFRLFLFANVGDDSENPATITYFHEVAVPYAARHGIELVELHRIPTRGPHRGEIETLYGRLTRPGSRSLPIPVRMANGAPGTRACTAVLSTGGGRVSGVSGGAGRADGAAGETPLLVVCLVLRVIDVRRVGPYRPPMQAQRILMPSTGETSWTVVGDDLLPIPAVESFLLYLAAIERSPGTVRSYAYALAEFFRFLAGRGVGWREANLDTLAGFVFWLRKPAPEVVVLAIEESRRAPRTVNRITAAVASFYAYQARVGVDVGVAEQLVVWRRIGRRDFRPFLHHISKGRPVATSALSLRTARRLPKTLTGEQVQTLLDACRRLRDRFLLALLYETGMRVGQALGLRHEDMRTWERVVAIVPRADNANGARAKTPREHEVHISAELCRLFSDYMHDEYGDIDSDYVFVNLWGGRAGHALSYPAVAGLVGRLRARSGIEFHLHQLRHTHVTELLRGGVRLEVASKRVTHASTQTTEAFYDHLTVEDLRPEVEAFWAEREAAQ